MDINISSREIKDKDKRMKRPAICKDRKMHKNRSVSGRKKQMNSEKKTWHAETMKEKTDDKKKKMRKFKRQSEQAKISCLPTTGQWQK